MNKQINSKSGLGSFARFAATSTIHLAFVAVGYVAGQRGVSPGLEATAYANGNIPAFLESASGGKQLSLATGRIEDGIEGIFGVDHLTGDLFCWVLNPTTGELASTFRVNVATALGVDGDADYVMCTGLMDFRGGRTGGDRISHSVVYVADGNTGNVAGFSLIYDAQALSRGNASAGELKQIATMITRDPRAVRNQGTDGK